MGLEIDREHFAPEEVEAFTRRLHEDLEALRQMLARPGFGVGPATVGAELEVSLIDGDARPLARNREVLAGSADARLTVELDRFNLECNLRHGALIGRPFAGLRAELESAFAEMSRAAAAQGGRVVPIGILPTLRAADLQPSVMTDSVRFRALSESLRRIRREPFRFDIRGEDHLEMCCDDVTFEGAATSFQLHLRVDPDRFAATFNAAQMATAPVLAAAGNSPTFLGRRLWEETRVALFKQAVDARRESMRDARPARVSFGSAWIRDAFELFEESVMHFPPLLPVLSDEVPAEVVRAGGIAALRELRLHQGTVWSWNRPVYDAGQGGHLRIELRALPAGPTTEDMLANAAFLFGLVLALRPDAEAWTRGLPFEDAHHNFYRAAQRGLDAELAWPEEPGAPPAPVQARRLLVRLLPLAQQGLDAAGVAREDSAPLLRVVERRVASGRTGAAWQRSALSNLERERERDGCFGPLLEHYLARFREGAPVHEWSVPGNP